MARQSLTPRSQRRAGYWLLGGGLALALRSWDLLPLNWPCPLRQATGVPCPTCFLTRSLMSALRGDLPASLHWHPLGIPLLVVVAVITALLLLGRFPAPSRLGLWLAGALGTTWVVWFIRLWSWYHGSPLPG